MVSATGTSRPTSATGDLGFGYDGAGTAATDYGLFFDESTGTLLLHDASNVQQVSIDDDGSIVAGSLALSGDLTGLTRHTITTGPTHSPAETAMRGDWHFYSNAGIVTVTLPAISGDGNSACFHDRDGTAVLRIDPNAADNIILNGQTVMTDGEFIASAGAGGDFICLLEYDAASWIALGRSGIWVEETP